MKVSGKFSSWFPFDRGEYDKLKKSALNKVRLSRNEKKYQRKFAVMVAMLKKCTKLSYTKIAEMCSEEFKEEFTGDGLQGMVERLLDRKYNEEEAEIAREMPKNP